MIKNKRSKMLAVFAMVLISSLGCGKQNNSSKNDRSFLSILLGIPAQPTMKSVTRSVVSLNEPIGLRSAQEESENEQDFDESMDVKKRILIPTVEFLKPHGVAKKTVQNIILSECTGSFVANLQPEEFVTFLKTHDLDCIDNFVWTYDQYSNSIYSQANMLAVMRQFSDIAPVYDGTNGLKFLQLYRIFWAGFYLKYFYPSIPFDRNRISQDLIVPLQIFGNSSNFLSGTDEAGEILYSFFATANNAEIGEAVYPNIVSFLEISLSDQQRLTNSYSQANALFAVFTLINRQTHPSFPQFLASIDTLLIEALAGLALNTSFNNDSQVWIVNTAIYSLNNIYHYLPVWQSMITLVLTDVLNTYPYLSEPYLWAVRGVTQNSDCANLSTGQICLSVTKNSVKAMAFPNTYSFDDGTQVVYTSLSLTSIQPLYHALKQVESQFFRLVEILAPVSGDPTDSISMYVYGSLKDYRVFHPFLFDLATNNGGIYIESNKSFYTYQRTPAESMYTLEELLRHEYVHYLVGRFIIPGMWGQGSVYANERLTWFDEGMAEFLAGSTPKEIRPRKVLVSQIQYDASSRMNVPQIVTAHYGDFKFYRYAGNFFHYLYTYKKNTLRDLIRTLRDSNIQAFDSLVAQISQDTSLDTSYQSYLDSLVLNVNTLTNPATETPKLADLSTNDPAVIQSILRATTVGSMAKCTTAVFGINGRFSCRGMMSGSLRSSPDWIVAWSEFNSGINNLISTLETNQVNNLGSMNCRMGEIYFSKYSNQFYPSALYSCEGPLAYRTPISYSHPAQDQLDFRDTTFGVNSTCLTSPTSGTICNSPISTSVFPSTATYNEMFQFLNWQFNDLKAEVFMMRPPLYKRLNCGLNSITTVSNQTTGNQYLSAISTCSL
ncbi:collagenase ColA [Leptospira mayottensis]|uniref:collagenase ColA n=1 Tax=Leptospira mayottensis TaxID=1137606 RepID=UPI0002BE4420|nr:collagenase [Leptospira mayottensis]AZQ01096.1 collagenase [Leptospira mayottensis 200901116]TGN17423.1 collagenase [Leptospira mayottensis]